MYYEQMKRAWAVKRPLYDSMFSIIFLQVTQAGDAGELYLMHWSRNSSVSLGLLRVAHVLFPVAPVTITL